MADDNSDKVREVFENGESVDPIEGPSQPMPEVEADQDVVKCALYPLNDFGNGQRYTDYFGQDVISVPRVSWYCWNEKLWVRDDDNILVRAKAQQVAAKIKEEIDYLALEDWELQKLAEEPVLIDLRDEIDALGMDKSRDQIKERVKIAEKLSWIDRIKARKLTLKKDHRSHAKASGNSAKIDNMMKEAAVGLSHDLEKLDVDPIVINTQNGQLIFTVDKAEQLRRRKAGEGSMNGTVSMAHTPHDRAMLLSKITEAAYEPYKEAPLFDAFLERIQPDFEIRAFLQRWFGLSMTGLNGEQKMVFLYGDGANGKSVLVDLIAKMMGNYAATAAIESLTGTQKRGGGEATPDLIPLIGARFVRSSEPEQGERLKEAEIKKMTGGEPIQMRANYGDTIEVLPVFKLTMSGNYKPEIRGTDNGIWRRILLVLFGVVIPEEEQDDGLGAKLWVERSGILNWLIEGLMTYLEDGLNPPASVLAATNEFREESDPVGTFLTDCCDMDPDAAFISSATMLHAFKVWMKLSGRGAWTDATVTKRISERAGKWRHPKSGLQFAKHKQSISGYRGIKLTSDHQFEMDKDDQSKSSTKS